MKLLDLHTHSSYSDGTYAPSAIVDLALRKGLYGLSITDHDCVDGIEEAIEYAKYKNIIFVPGIEFSCFYGDEEIHILGYNIDHKCPSLLDITNRLRNARLERALKMIQNLNSMGFEISFDDLEKQSLTSIGRPHIGQALVEKGYARSIQETFEKYLSQGMPAYVERYRLLAQDAIRLIHEAGGVSVIAHPYLIKNQSCIDALAAMGIDGLEAYHSSHSNSNEKRYIYMARRLGLCITGGSDFHGRDSDFDFFGRVGIKLEELDSKILNR